jgi:hypothetical protein
MNSNGEIMNQALVDDDAKAATYDEEHFNIIARLLKLQAELNVTPKHGGSKFGIKMSKPR